MELKWVAMIIARSRPHVLYGASARASVLWVIIRGKDLKFADHVRGLRKIVNRACQTLSSRRVEQSDAIEHGDPRLRLTAVDVCPGDVAAASDHARKDLSKIGRPTHAPANNHRNLLYYLPLHLPTTHFHT